MSTIITDRPVNPGQLSLELGRKPVRVIGPRRDGTTKVDARGTGTDNLAAAIDAHQADPDWTDPDPPPPPEPTRLEQLRARAREARAGNAPALTRAELDEATTLLLER